MHLFRMKATLDGESRMPEFLAHNYICFGKPGIGNLEQRSRSELTAQLAEAPLDDQERRQQLKDYCTFAYEMQDGDYVVVDDGAYVHVGDVGDYYYLDSFDNDEDRSGHRRGVTWLRSLQREEVHPELAAFLGQAGEIGIFGHPLTDGGLEHLLSKPAAEPGRAGFIDEATIQEALGILRAAMRSEDAERRERAAIAILQAVHARGQ
ncbi:hypothetical protein [Paenibacillus sp. R14(2021)]|uniref:hypothetical protein n=1 Tax=Paenibacillus sp. R14(2021) TaxID=2859228 RepID=UPI001C612A1B|nr:hypothetical protein [Paenibacillus sp. R14(2021)]